LGVTGVLTATGGIELSHATANTLTASSGVLSIEGNVVYSAGGTDVPVADGGTGASTMLCGGILLGSGTGAITAMSVLAAGAIVKGDGSGDPVALTRGSANQVLTTKCCDISWAAAASGGAMAIVGTVEASCDATITITGLDSTYDSYLIELSNMVPASTARTPRLRLGDSSGVDSGSCDYGYVMAAFTDTTTTPENQLSTGNCGINWASAGVGNAAGHGVSAIFTLHRPGDGSMFPILTGQSTFIYGVTGNLRGNTIMAQRNSVITLDRVQFLFNAGCIKEGRMTVWGMGHA